MTPLAPLVTTFFQRRLRGEQGVSPNTYETYRHAFVLLLRLVSAKVGKPPKDLALEDLNASRIREFLTHLETERGNTARSRNHRLTAIRAFMKFVQFEIPAALDLVSQVYAIPRKRTQQRLVHYLDREESRAVLETPDSQTRLGQRDRALLALGISGGLRASELVGLQMGDLELSSVSPGIRVLGKGRKERWMPLDARTLRLLEEWLAVRGRSRVPYVFLNWRGEGLTRFGLGYILRKHADRASETCASLGRKRVTPHAMRHSAAMHTLEATRDIRKVALWLGHENLRSSEVYLRADPTEKLEALEPLLPQPHRRGHFDVPEDFLESLRICGPEASQTLAGTRRPRQDST